MQTEEDLLAGLRHLLSGPGRDRFSDFLVSLTMTGEAGPASAETVAAAVDLGLVTKERLRPTGTGYLVADSLREHRFWIGRDRKLPFEGQAAPLSAAYFAGKRTLEVGSGAGCNLWSLGLAGVEAVGLEPQPLYVAIGKILCEIEGIAAPPVHLGQAEQMPFAAEEFDIVLCISAHEYMDVRRAFTEFARVLRPGGEMLIVSGTLGTHLDVGLRPVLAGNPKALKPYLVAIANTLGYQALGRRLLGQEATATTAYPIYPTRGYMARLLAGIGMEQLRPPCALYPETCYNFRKPAVPGRSPGIVAKA